MDCLNCTTWAVSVSGKGFIYMYNGVCVCVWGGIRFADFILFSFKYPMKMKQFGLTETKLFHFHRIFKNGGQGGGSSKPPEPPLDLPLYKLLISSQSTESSSVISLLIYNTMQSL